MKKIAVILSVLLLVATAGEAVAASCYGPREIEAEQGLRIHSELMVIGLTCLKMPGGEQMYMQYNTFTRKNQHLISQYEEDIIKFYSTQGGGAEKKLHTLRTNLANKISQHAIKMSTGNFCRNFGPRIQKALSMDQATLRRWAQRVWADTPTSQPICASM